MWESTMATPFQSPYIPGYGSILPTVLGCVLCCVMRVHLPTPAALLQQLPLCRTLVPIHCPCRRCATSCLWLVGKLALVLSTFPMAAPVCPRTKQSPTQFEVSFLSFPLSLYVMLLTRL
eukprot:GGOE01012922.1.p1 GENE.GGOE01012922.1~~GGOE01012922.1.p1  ORF type:complete len:137 (+),score=1.58 GGOE01012922.1:55-411(+)